MRDVLEMLADDKAARAVTAEQNRRDFPFVADWKSALEAEFGPVTVTHASNGAKEIGERFESRCAREGHVPCEYRPQGDWA